MDDTEYPKALYRPGTAFDWDGVKLDSMEANSADEEEAALGEGWVLHVSDIAAEPKSEPTLLDRNAKEIAEALPALSLEELEQLKAEETGGKTRKGVLSLIEAAIDAKLKG